VGAGRLRQQATAVSEDGRADGGVISERWMDGAFVPNGLTHGGVARDADDTTRQEGTTSGHAARQASRTSQSLRTY